MSATSADERSTSIIMGRAIPKIANPVKPMHHTKGGGSREGSITFMYSTNCQGIKN